MLDVGRVVSRGGKLGAIWDARSRSWHQHVETSDAFDRIRVAVLAEAAPSPSMRAVDLGAGTGFLALALAPNVHSVLAVDVSPVMVDALAKGAADRGLDNVGTLVEDLASVDLPAGSVDLIVSSYALHHLKDADKVALVRRARSWLRPGGRLVIADMMFGRGGSARDRQILRIKIAALMRKGPHGAFRVVKNLVRFGLRIGVDRPVPPEFWVDSLQAGGFSDVRYEAIVAEAGIVTGVA